MFSDSNATQPALVQPEQVAKTEPQLEKSKAEIDNTVTTTENQAANSEDTLLPEAQPTYPRSEVIGKSTLRANAVHVYGLDFLKTDHMNEIFGQFNHKYIEWMNDSSANIIFKDAATAKRALESLSFPKVGDDPWRRTPDILVNEDLPPIFLQLRTATSLDIKQPKKAVPKVLSVSHRGDRYENVQRTKPGRQQMYSDVSEVKQEENTNESTNASVPSRRKAVVCEEEVQKRLKRAERFGKSAETQRNIVENAPSKEGESPVTKEVVPAQGETQPAEENAEATKENTDVPLNSS